MSILNDVEGLLDKKIVFYIIAGLTLLIFYAFFLIIKGFMK